MCVCVCTSYVGAIDWLSIGISWVLSAGTTVALIALAFCIRGGAFTRPRRSKPPPPRQYIDQSINQSVIDIDERRYSAGVSVSTARRKNIP